MDIVEITLPVTRSAAERLRQPGERARLGALVSLAAESLIGPDGMTEAMMLGQARPEERRLRTMAALAGVQQAAVEAGLSAGEVEEELAAWKRERADVRRP